MPDLTNLLPPERTRLLARDYAYRAATTMLVMVGILAVVHGALLAPTYLYARDQQELRAKRLSELSEKRAASGYEELSSRIATFSSRLARLADLRIAPSASDSIRAILAAPRPGVTLSSFTFAAAEGGGGERMTVSGTAATRESLRSFEHELGSLSFVRSTDLPLSTYAKESAIPFSIALALDFKKP